MRLRVATILGGLALSLCVAQGLRAQNPDTLTPEQSSAKAKQIINQLHWKPPGAAAAEFAYHQDVRSRRPRTAYRNLPDSYVQTGIAIDPHHGANGGMRLYPRSHLLGENDLGLKGHSLGQSVGDAQLIAAGLDPSKLVDLNLTHTFLCTKIIGGAMLARGDGRVINIASISGMIANRGIGGRHYETTKAAVIHFTRATAADWAARGVTVNAICPGLFMTEPNLAWSKSHPEVIDTLVRGIPIGRPGEPHEIGPLAVYLASPASSYVTGASFVIDGGYTLW